VGDRASLRFHPLKRLPLLPLAPALLVGIVLLPGLLPGVGGLSAQAGREEVFSLGFTGNRAVADGALEVSILTRATSCLSWVLQPLCWAGAEFAVDRFYRNPRAFAQDVARLKVFYYQRGYREAVVDTVVQPSGEGVRVTFQIQEGRPILVESLELVGVEEVEESRVAAEVVRDLPIRPGDPLDLLQLDTTRIVLESRLRDRGYPQADVLLSYFIPSDTPYSARVAFDVYPGPHARFGPIVVEGNQLLSETVIRRMLPFREGTRYQRELLFEGQRNLFSLEVFRQVEIVQDLEFQPDTLVPLRLRVSEGNLHRVRTGVGWSTADCLNAEARWTDRNFMGGARRVQVRGRVSNILAEQFEDSFCPQAGVGDFGDLNWLVASDFTQPFIFSARNSATAGIFAERQSLQDVFIRQALGLNLALSRSIGRGAFLNFSYRPQLASLRAAEIFFCSSFLVCDPGDIGALQSRNTLAPVGVGATRDRTNRLLNPTGGYRLLLDLEHASRVTGSAFGYDRVIGEAAFYREMGRSSVLAYRFRGGHLNPREFSGLSERAAGREVAHPQKRFYAGGANSVRGFAQNQLGPRVLTVDVVRLVDEVEGRSPPCTPEQVIALTCDAGILDDGEFAPRPTGGGTVVEGNVEFRFPVYRNLLQGAAFVDLGQVWGEASGVEPGEIRWSPGVGLRYLSPIGPLRVDLGYRTVGGGNLPVITSQLRPFRPESDDPEVRVFRGVDDDYVVSDELALLTPTVLFGESDPWSWRRFQIHLSIGQAF